MTSLWLDTHPVAERGVPLVGGARYDVVVVGAGLTGLATALLLARSGRRTCLVEARSVGAVTTGNTTGKVSLLQGTLLGEIRRRHGDEVLRAYVAANAEGQRWLLDVVTAHGVDHQRRPALSYAMADRERTRLEREHAAAMAAGLNVDWDPEVELPFPVAGSLRLAEQFQLHPTELLDALLAQFLAHGGVLHTGCRVRDIRTRRGCRVVTSAGAIECDRAVVATGTPFPKRGALFARLQAHRSYAAAFRVPGEIPRGMYLSAGGPTRSLRTASGAAGELLLVGGNGHWVGRQDSPRARLDDLVDWTRRHFPGATATQVWSAQDYRPTGGLPLVGELPGSGGRIQVATGYQKWGMTNAVAAAQRLTAALDGRAPAWADVLDRASTGTAGVVRAAGFTAQVAADATTGWLGAEFRGLPDAVPEGCGVVGRLGGRPAARATAGGVTRTVSAVCPHLGGIVSWNDAESSWDCPLHGSRFDVSGRLLEGPAVTDLPAVE